jgi:hypothetical protein
MNGDRITSDESCLELVSENTGTSQWRVKWTDVNEIVAWKDDRGMHDTIFIGFRVLGSDEYFCCNEEQQGWDRLLSMLKLKFPEQPADWYSQVAFPAFRTNRTVLWKGVPERE